LSWRGGGVLYPVRLIEGDTKCNLSCSHCDGSRGEAGGVGVRRAGLPPGQSRDCVRTIEAKATGLRKCHIFILSSGQRYSAKHLTSNISASSSGCESREDLSFIESIIAGPDCLKFMGTLSFTEGYKLKLGLFNITEQEGMCVLDSGPSEEALG
jgi:hypothetical protein